MRTVSEYVDQYPDCINGWYDYFKKYYPQWRTEEKTIYMIWYKEIYLNIEMYWKQQKRFGIITEIRDGNFKALAIGNRKTDGLVRYGQLVFDTEKIDKRINKLKKLLLT